MSLQTSRPSPQLDPVSLDWLGAVVSQQHVELVARWDAAVLAKAQVVPTAPFHAVVAGRAADHWYYATIGCAVHHARSRMLANPAALREGMLAGRVAARPTSELLPELTIRIASHGEAEPPSWPAVVFWDVATRWLAGELALERDTLVPQPRIAACPDLAALALAWDRGFLFPVMTPLGAVKPLQVVGLLAPELAVARSWQVAAVVSLLAQHDRQLRLGVARDSVIATPAIANELGAAIAAEVDPETALEITDLDWDLIDERGESAAITLPRVWCALLGALIRSRLGNGLPLRLVDALDGGRIELVLRPAEETGWTSDGERLVLAIARGTAQELADHLIAATPRIEVAGVPLIAIVA